MINDGSLRLLLLAMCLGCSSEEPLADENPAVMVEGDHSHYHVHGPGIEHDHTHDPEFVGGHEHQHSHEDNKEVKK